MAKDIKRAASTAVAKTGNLPWASFEHQRDVDDVTRELKEIEDEASELDEIIVEDRTIKWLTKRLAQSREWFPPDAAVRLEDRVRTLEPADWYGDDKYVTQEWCGAMLVNLIDSLPQGLFGSAGMGVANFLVEVRKHNPGFLELNETSREIMNGPIERFQPFIGVFTKKLSAVAEEWEYRRESPSWLVSEQNELEEQIAAETARRAALEGTCNGLKEGETVQRRYASNTGTIVSLMAGDKVRVRLAETYEVKEYNACDWRNEAQLAAEKAEEERRRKAFLEEQERKKREAEELKRFRAYLEPDQEVIIRWPGTPDHRASTMYHAEGEKVCVTLLEREWCGYVKIDLVWPVDSVAGK